MRVLRNYMQEVFTEQTLTGQTALSNMVNTPQTNNVDQFISMINQIPEND